jgi:hypothetical protein
MTTKAPPAELYVSLRPTYSGGKEFLHATGKDVKEHARVGTAVQVGVYKLVGVLVVTYEAKVEAKVK